MSEHVFRNPDKVEQLAYRDYIRERFPNGSEGYVAEDIDLVIRVYGDPFGTDAIGKLMLLELKMMGFWPGVAQLKTFGLIDQLMRRGDPSKRRYLGFFIVQYSDEDWNQATFCVNKKYMPRRKFNRFLMTEDVGIKGWFD